MHSIVTYYNLKYKSMSYSCITSWRLNNSNSTADEQPQCYGTDVKNVVISCTVRGIIVMLLLHVLLFSCRTRVY